MLTAPQTALGQAADSGDNRAVKAALKQGADPNTVDGGTTVLNRAAFAGHTAVVKTLIGKGAEVGTPDSRGYFALQLAASGNHGTTIKALLALGADTEQTGATGGTALHAAAAQGLTKSLGALIKGGAKLDALDEHGAPPIVYTAIHGHKKAFSALRKAGARIDIVDNTGKSLLMQLLASAYRYRVEHWRSEGHIGDRSVAYEVSNGAFTYYSEGKATYISSKNIKLISGRHCPEHMKFLDRVDLARAVLRSDVDLSVRDHDGWTAMLYVARLNVDLIGEFIKRGADVQDVTPEGRGVLHLMAAEPIRSEYWSVAVLRSALRKKFKLKHVEKLDAALSTALNAPDQHGWAPIHYLAWQTGKEQEIRPYSAYESFTPSMRRARTTAEQLGVPAGKIAQEIAQLRDHASHYFNP